MEEAETLRAARAGISHDQAAELVRKCKELERRWQVGWDGA
jgi:hypothetical protein